MRKSHEADNHSICSTANQRKRGLARFSLRRLLYSSPLVARRITRGSSNTSKNSRNTGVYSYVYGCWGVYKMYILLKHSVLKFFIIGVRSEAVRLMTVEDSCLLEYDST